LHTILSSITVNVVLGNRCPFRPTQDFDRTAQALLSDDDEGEIEKSIADDPEGAPVIPATGGVRKIRGRVGQRGKRGGVRVLYLYVAATETVYLLLVFPKSAREDISKAQKRTIRALVERLREEQGSGPPAAPRRRRRIL
jgi:mRNA-degrading endonuclease RelE of RelBE toxin-antitoxin system